MRNLAQALFGLVTNALTVILAVFIGCWGAAIGFIIGLVVFGLMGLTGWWLATPCLILAAIGFLLGVLVTWGFTSTVDDVGEAIGKKLRG